jgi:outer membrane receptor protein involved in Fe transport
LQVKLPNRQKLSFGFGLHSKHEKLPVYFVEQQSPIGEIYMPNLSLQMTRSIHYIAGYDLLFGNNLHLKIEAYYQDINKLAVPDNTDKLWIPSFGGVNPEDTLSNMGEGRNYGLELSFQKYFTEGFYFLSTASLYDSKYKPANGRWYNTRYNGNYIFNMVAGKEIKWGSNKLLGFSSRMLWHGGKRLLGIDLEESIQQGETVLDMNEWYTTKARDYFRIDLGLKLHLYKERVEHIIAVDIQNITNRLNTWTQYYNSDTESIEDYYMAGIIPILTYRIEF